MNDLFLLQPDGEGDLVLQQEGKPFLANEFSVREEHAHSGRIETGQIAFHQGNPLGRRAVAGMREQGPHQGNTKSLGDDGQDQHVHVGLADLPIGPVQAEVPTLWPADQCDHEADGPILGQANVLEKPLQPTVGRCNHDGSRPFACDVRQVHGSGANHTQNQQAKRLQAGLAQGQMRR